MKDNTAPATYHRVVDRIRGLALAFSHGRLTQEQFVSELLAWEQHAVSPAGLTLSVCKTEDEWTSVLVKHSPTGKLHAAFEFLPEASRFRPVRDLSQYTLQDRPGIGVSGCSDS